jgi:hypothetical protein
LDTTDAGVIRHDYVEEVYLLEGEAYVPFWSRSRLSVVTNFR